MKLLRRLLLVLVVLALLFGIVALDSRVQTLIARAWLSGQPGVRATIGSLSVGLPSPGWSTEGWTQIEVTNLRVQFDRTLLGAAAVTLQAPLKSVLGLRPLHVRRLTAKGWTLDLNHGPTAGGRPAATGQDAATAEPVPPHIQVARQVLLATRELLTGGGFPRGLSFDDVELEGDVRLPAAPGTEARWRRVVIQGGGLAPGQDGVFTVRVTEPATNPGTHVASDLRLLVRLDAESRFERVRIERSVETDTSAASDLPVQIAFEAGIVRPANEESYALDVTRDGRRILHLDTRRSVSTADYAGTWGIDARDDDLASLGAAPPAIGMILNGGGPFTADTDLARLRVTGKLAALAGSTDRLPFARTSLGTLSIATGFDLSLDGTVLRLAQFNGSVTGTGPLAAIELQQPIGFDTATRRFIAPDPAADWLQVSLHGLPLALFPRLPAPWDLTGGNVTGELVAGGDGDAVSIRTISPFAAAGTNLQLDGRTWGEGLDLSVGLQASWTPTSWRIDAAQFAIASQGRPLASGSGRADKSSGASGRMTLTGKWEADMDALSAQPIGREIGWLPGKTITGEFSARLGTWNEVSARIVGVGRVPGRTLEATVSASVDDQGRLTFLVPAKIAFGSRVTDLTAEGTWTGGSSPRFVATLTGQNAELEHLRPLAGPVGWLADFPTPRPSSGISPFLPGFGSAQPATAVWGEVPGSIRIMLGKLRANRRDYEDVGGWLTLDHGAVRLEGGHVRMPPYNTAKLDGSITFEPSAALPYRLNATAAISGLDATALLPASSSTQAPMWEGKYTAALKATSAAGTVDELWRRRTDEFQLTSDAGIIRLLGTRIADAIPRNEPKTNETLARLGAALGEVFRTRREDDIEVVPSAISREAETVLNFTYRIREIPYSALAVTAFRTADGTIHLNEIMIEGSQERLTGTGQIAGAAVASLPARPLRLDLNLSVRHEAAHALADTGLLSEENDAKGYTRFAEPIHLGGTLDRIDDTQWRELLVKAALRKP